MFLTVPNDGTMANLGIEKGDYAGANWKLSPAGNGCDNFANEYAQGKSLDVVNDDKKDSVQVVKTENVSGQCWKMTPVGNDYFRLTNSFLGETKSLEAAVLVTFSLEMAPKSDTDPGQLWKMTNISSGK